MKLSIVIPAYNEGESIVQTIDEMENVLSKVDFEYEIFIVNDNSKDDTLEKIVELTTKYSSIKYSTNKGPNGYGYAVRHGLERYTGDCVAIMMADLSESPEDLVRFMKQWLRVIMIVFLEVVSLKEER